MVEIKMKRYKLERRFLTMNSMKKTTFPHNFSPPLLCKALSLSLSSSMFSVPKEAFSTNSPNSTRFWHASLGFSGRESDSPNSSYQIKTADNSYRRGAPWSVHPRKEGHYLLVDDTSLPRSNFSATRSALKTFPTYQTRSTLATDELSSLTPNGARLFGRQIWDFWMK